MNLSQEVVYCRIKFCVALNQLSNTAHISSPHSSELELKSNCGEDKPPLKGSSLDGWMSEWQIGL